MWIGNIKVQEKITETLIFFCQVLMIFFFAVLLNEYDNYTNAQDFNAFFNFFNYNYDGEEVEPHRWIEKTELNLRFFKRLKNNLNNLNQNVFSTCMISMELISVTVLFVCLFVFLFFVSPHLNTGRWTVRIEKKVLKTTHNIDANRKSKC